MLTTIPPTPHGADSPATPGAAAPRRPVRPPARPQLRAASGPPKAGPRPTGARRARLPRSAPVLRLGALSLPRRPGPPESFSTRCPAGTRPAPTGSSTPPPPTGPRRALCRGRKPLPTTTLGRQLAGRPGGQRRPPGCGDQAAGEKKREEAKGAPEAKGAQRAQRAQGAKGPGRSGPRWRPATSWRAEEGEGGPTGWVRGGGPKRTDASPSGNRTPVSRVTGGDTHHYTNEDDGHGRRDARPHSDRGRLALP